MRCFHLAVNMFGLDPFVRGEVSLRGARVQARGPRDLITAPGIVLKFPILLLKRVNIER